MAEISDSSSSKVEKRILFHADTMAISFENNQTVLSPAATRCLSLLLRFEGDIVSKEQILQECWLNKGVFVTDASVRQLITQLRKSFNDLGISDTPVATVPRQGYTLQKGIVITSVNADVFESPSIDDQPLNESHSEISNSLHFKPAGWRPANILLCVTLIASLLSSWFLLKYYHQNAISVVQYEAPVQVGGHSYYLQRGQHFTPEITKEFDKLQDDQILDLESYSYIYVNRTEIKGYLFAFLCREPIDNVNSDCKTLTIFRGDHG